MRITRGGVVAGLLAAVVAMVCIRLGFWQLDRLEQRRSVNAAVTAAMALPPLSLDSATFDRIGRDPRAFQYRYAQVSGRFIPGSDIVLRGRSHQGQPGVHLVSALRLHDSDQVVLVNRGWIPAPDAATVDPRPFVSPGPRRVEGILQTIPEAGDDNPVATIQVGDTSVTTRRRLDFASVRREMPGPVLPLYLEARAGESSEPPVPIPPPTLDEGPHLGYAIQWFSFAAIAVVGFVSLVVLRTRSRDTRRNALWDS